MHSIDLDPQSFLGMWSDNYQIFNRFRMDYSVFTSLSLYSNIPIDLGLQGERIEYENN
jgi:hypothetical protein